VNTDRQNRTTMRRLMLTTLGLLILGGCAAHEPAKANLNESFGNAVRHNTALQTINPDAAGPDESDRIDGQTAEQALQEMRTRSNESQSGSLIINVGN
jgi:type IV pilus biogenesis protein CpaD/CtpE